MKRKTDVVSRPRICGVMLPNQWFSRWVDEFAAEWTVLFRQIKDMDMKDMDMKTAPAASFMRHLTSLLPHFHPTVLSLLVLLGLSGPSAQAQTLVNVDFGVGAASPKSGWAATGQWTNDFWNLYRHYEPRFVPGMPLVDSGRLADLKFADGSPSTISIGVTNAPGVWGNSTGDPMFDTYLFSTNGSNITVTIHNLTPGRYHVYLYGHADSDISGEQNSVFSLWSSTNRFGPQRTAGMGAWKAPSAGSANGLSGWREGYQYVLFRDVQVFANEPVIIQVAAGPNGVPVLNGLQILSRGTSPPELPAHVQFPPPDTATNLLFHEVKYEGVLSDREARFTAEVKVESRSTNEIAGFLFDNRLAVLASNLPLALRLVSSPAGTMLVARAPGVFSLHFTIAAGIQRAEPWNNVSFAGPAAAIASIQARAEGEGVELQWLSGTPMADDGKPATGVIKGLVGADRLVSLRWQSKTTEARRKSFVIVDATASAQITSTVIKYTTEFKYDVLQAGVARLTLLLPADQALTRLQGDQVRDWRLEPKDAQQLLTVEFVKPVEKTCKLTLLSEQNVSATNLNRLEPPQPRDVDRESGSFTLSAEDAVVEVESVAGLRQVNAPQGALLAYRFSGRPMGLSTRITRVEPVVKVNDRMTARLEETRLVVDHALALNVEKTGIYMLEFTPPRDMVVAQVQGEGVDSWKHTGDVVRVGFSGRVMGARVLNLQLEQAFKEFPGQIVLAPLRTRGAETETAEVGAAAAPGLRIKVQEMSGVRELPINQLSNRRDESLAFASTQAGWQVTLATERLAPRILSDTFNLVTIGEGLVGGSAAIRFALVNQGVRELRVQLPDHWKNVEFTGPGIRRKELRDGVWEIGLQDKAWGSYTLLVTYDFGFDPKGATLPIGGVRVLDAERETGTIALTAAPGLQLKAQNVQEPLRRIDESELAREDRALILRPVVLAYRYTGHDSVLQLGVARFDQARLLEAVADRTQLTTVLTDAGQMLTQASFMVKNNEKQYQRFRLPAGAEFWSSFVNNDAVKAEKDGDWLLVPLPRVENRDQAFAVDLVYAQKMGTLRGMGAQPLQLEAPRTDVPNTYAEWQLYVPRTAHLARFGGTMAVAQGTVYGWMEAWNRFKEFYLGMVVHAPEDLALMGGMGLLLFAMALGIKRHGGRGLLAAVGLVVVLGILLAMILPATSKAKRKAVAARYEAEQAAAAVQSPTVGLMDNAVSQPSAMETLPPPPAKSELAAVPQNMPAVQPPQAAQERHAGVALQTDEVPQAGRGVAAPRESGIRPIRIEIPREGEPFVFTKVLNVGGETLSVHARIMSKSRQLAIRSTFEAGALLLGLLILWRQWGRTVRSGLWMAVGLVLACGSVAHLLLTLRVFHAVLIGLAPFVVLAFLVWVIWKTPRKIKAAAVPPVIALWVMMCGAVLCRGQGVPDPAGILQSATNAVSIVSAQYEGQATDTVATFDVQIRLQTTRTNQFVPLFGPEVAVRQFSVVPENARLVREGNSLGVQLVDAGDASVRATILVKTGGDVTQRRLAFAMPKALFNQFKWVINEPGAEVECPAAVALHRTEGARDTTVEAIVGPVGQFDLVWTPRVKRAAEVAATVFCNNLALVTLGGGVANTRAQLDYQVTQGEMRQLRIGLPAGHRLLRVEGDMVRTWEQSESSGAAVVMVDLIKGATQNCRVTVETEVAMETLPARMRLTVPHALDVKRETGLIGLRGGEELSLVFQARDLQRVDAPEWARVAGQPAEGLLSVFRFLNPDFELYAQIEVARPEIEAVMRQNLLIGSEQVRLTALVQYQVKRAGVFQLNLRLPDRYRVEQVKGGNILQWLDKRADGSGVLEVRLKEKVVGDYALQVDLTLPWKDLPRQFAVEGVHPLGVEKLNGFLAVSSELGITVKTSSMSGLTEVPVASLPTLNPAPQEATRSELVPPASGTLAYKYMQTAPADTAPWKLMIDTETVEAWLRAEIAHVFTVTDAVISGRATVRYEIANAPLKEFRLRVPESWRNVEISAPNIRARDHEGGLWRVELQNKVRGSFSVNVTWEMPSATNILDSAGVTAQGAERESGWVAVVAKPPLQVLATSLGDLRKIDPTELPEWAGRAMPDTVLACRYLRPGWTLPMEMRRYQEAEVLQALADSARLTTVVADDGQSMTEMVLAIRNSGRQYLEVELPSGAEVWSVFVGTQPVRPSVREGRVLVPLERSAGDGAVSLELIYISTNAFPRTRGNLEFNSPKWDVPLKNATWELYLPPGYRYVDFTGTMSYTWRETPIVTSMASRYSLDEYSRQEDAKKAEWTSEVQSNVKVVQSNLAKGNVKDAAASLRQLRSAKKAYAAAEQDLKQIESDFNRAQSSNLLARQNEFGVENNARLDGVQVAVGAVGGQMPSSQAGYFNFDNEAAERQWSKLQQAQEVAQAEVKPLRVNLPVRGAHFSFKQVLQTEVGKPMTIQMHAINIRRTGWLGWTLAVGGGFLLLWLWCAVAFGRKQTR